jgi:ABC-type spermidine/putrescine transport system permease subunit I
MIAAPAGSPRALERYLPVLFVAPITLVMLAMFVWPLVESIVNSFHPHTVGGVDRSHWTWANYLKLFDTYYLGVLWRTFRVSLATTLITAVLAFPVAWYTGTSCSSCCRCGLRWPISTGR